MRQSWERGYRATSVDDLGRATGVKPGSLYSAFPGGKHALLMGSLDRYSRLVVPMQRQSKCRHDHRLKPTLQERFDRAGLPG